MKKKGFVFVLSCAALTAALVLAGCGSAPVVTPDPDTAPDLTDVTSYYVRADGDDKNAGISEDAPFKTLARAAEAAAKTQVKKITVIGTLVGSTTIENADPTLQPRVKNQKGVVLIKGSLDENDPDEILITGKPGATGAERAILTPASQDSQILRISDSSIRLENIEISGLGSNKHAIIVVVGTLTLARGAKITKNAGIGVSALGGIVIMRDDAEISGNTIKNTAGAGVNLLLGSVMLMFDEALISGNKVENSPGGGVLVYGSSLLMHDNTAISANSADQNGGGIVVTNDTESGFLGQVTMSGNSIVSGNITSQAGGGIFAEEAAIIMNDNAKIIENTARLGGGISSVKNTNIAMAGSTVVSGNTATYAGGIALSDSELGLWDDAKITGNTATTAGGGVYGSDNPQLTWGKDTVITGHITGNTAPKDPDTNFTFD
ncbi:MAG: right-handed parallel beta-helix repeat-containing protein [Spirochaetaceae bacterium]|jgi:hypothetical protein|nr:right-handed parallel beta-helix repeat-containing protein [Spirochaetaceae bacterium]